MILSHQTANARCHPATIIIVPFLIASGGHGADDIPQALGVEPGTQTAHIAGRSVLFAEAVGEHPRLADVILEAADAAKTPARSPQPEPHA